MWQEANDIRAKWGKGQFVRSETEAMLGPARRALHGEPIEALKTE
ncbi:MAG TPA: hypothetical protein VFW98_13950 [Gemmatimonadaceae bacterium]|nr:hypothetical protein [Gemmatimonadaceae bacterium]